MRTSPRILAFVGLWLLVRSVAAQPTQATPSLESLTGTYTYIGDKAKDEATIQQQIKAATADMDMLVSRIAHDRLNAGNPIPTKLAIAGKGETITVTMDQHVISAPTDGTSKTGKNLGGHTVKASFHVKKASLVQDMVQSKGRRENIFRFDKAGNLVMQVKESSGELSAPVEYNLLYKRAPEK